MCRGEWEGGEWDEESVQGRVEGGEWEGGECAGESGMRRVCRGEWEGEDSASGIRVVHVKCNLIMCGGVW